MRREWTSREHGRACRFGRGWVAIVDASLWHTTHLEREGAKHNNYPDSVTYITLYLVSKHGHVSTLSVIYITIASLGVSCEHAGYRLGGEYLHLLCIHSKSVTYITPTGMSGERAPSPPYFPVSSLHSSEFLRTVCPFSFFTRLPFSSLHLLA